jgi:cytochrome c-type biogenesis protein CcmH/NrfF
VHRRTLLAAPLLLVTPGHLLLADEAKGDPHLEKLYRKFMSPCCWSETLLVHSSPIAEQLRKEVQQMIAAGKTDDEIKAVFIQRYGIRILSMPEGGRAQWLFLTPIAAAAAGLGALVMVIRRHLKNVPTSSSMAAPTMLPSDMEWD